MPKRWKKSRLTQKEVEAIAKQLIKDTGIDGANSEGWQYEIGIPFRHQWEPEVWIVCVRLFQDDMSVFDGGPTIEINDLTGVARFVD